MTRAHRTGFSFFAVGTKKRIELGVRRRVISVLSPSFDTETSAATRWKPDVAGHQVAPPTREASPHTHAVCAGQPSAARFLPSQSRSEVSGHQPRHLGRRFNVSARRVAQWSSRGRGRSNIMATLPRCVARSPSGRNPLPCCRRFVAAASAASSAARSSAC